MPNCLKCHKPLRSIGKNRKNGKNFVSGANNNMDWKERQYHKKCWKEEQDWIWLEMCMKEKEFDRIKKENELMRKIITKQEAKKEKELEDKFEENKFVVSFK